MDRCPFQSRAAAWPFALAILLASAARPGHASAATSARPDSIPGPRGFLGLVLASPGPGAPRVSEVLVDGASALSGVLPGDVVIAVDKRTVDDPASLAALLAPRGPGERVGLTLRRGTTLLDRTVTLGPAPRMAQPDLSARDFLKSDLRDLLAELRAAARRLTGRHRS